MLSSFVKARLCITLIYMPSNHDLVTSSNQCSHGGDMVIHIYSTLFVNTVKRIPAFCCGWTHNKLFSEEIFVDACVLVKNFNTQTHTKPF